MGRVDDSSDPDAVAEAIAATELNSLVGRIAFDGAGLPPFAAANVAKTPLVGGQWRLRDGGGYDLVIVDNSDQPDDPDGRRHGRNHRLKPRHPVGAGLSRSCLWGRNPVS